MYLQENELYFCSAILVNERRKWEAAETVLGSCRFVLPSCVSVLWKVFDPPCFSLTFTLLPCFLWCCPVAAFYGPLQPPRHLQVPCSLLICQLAQPPSDGSHLFVRPMDWRGQPTCGHAGSKCPSSVRQLVSPSVRVPHPGQPQGPGSRAMMGAVGLERVWASPGSLCDNFSSCFSWSSFALKSI